MPFAVDPALRAAMIMLNSPLTCRRIAHQNVARLAISPGRASRLHHDHVAPSSISRAISRMLPALAIIW